MTFCYQSWGSSGHLSRAFPGFLVLYFVNFSHLLADRPGSRLSDKKPKHLVHPWADNVLEGGCFSPESMLSTPSAPPVNVLHFQELRTKPQKALAAERGTYDGCSVIVSDYQHSRV